MCLFCACFVCFGGCFCCCFFRDFVVVVVFSMSSFFVLFAFIPRRGATSPFHETISEEKKFWEGDTNSPSSACTEVFISCS